MSTTNHATSVTTRSDLQAVGKIVDEQALQPRRVYLKKRAPRSRYVHDLRRQMRYGKRNPTQQRLSIAFSDIDDGIPVSLVRASFESEIALLEEYAAARSARATVVDAPAILPLVQRKSRVQAEQDATERELIADPQSVEACDRVLETNARYVAEGERMIGAVRRWRARLLMLSLRVKTTGLHATRAAGRDVPDGSKSTTAPAMYRSAGVRSSAAGAQ